MTRFLTLLGLLSLLASTGLWANAGTQSVAGNQIDRAASTASGSLALLSLDAGWSYADVTQQGSDMGVAVSSAGDVNGDGYADVIVGAPKYGSGGERVGAVLVFYGSGGGLCIGLTQVDPCPPDWQFISTTKGSLFGSSAASAGDVNGDGYDDILVGAPEYKEGAYKTGAAFVFYGSPVGLCAGDIPGCTAPWISISKIKDELYGYAAAPAGDIDQDGYADIMVSAPGVDSLGSVYVYRGAEGGLTKDQAPTWTFTGEQVDAGFGRSISAGGDVNGGGYTSLVIGAPNFDDPLYDAGKIFLYAYDPGSELWSAAPAWTASGQQAYARFGFSIQAAGDVNGDGYADLAVGAHSYDTTQPDVGSVFVYYGSALGLPAAASWQAESYQPYSWFGFSLGTAGDFNHDGYDDLIVGAHMYDENQPNQQGALFVYTGGSAGLRENPMWQALGPKAEAYLGKATANAGDVNGDGFSDLIAGAPGFFLSDTLVGQAAVYYGFQPEERPFKTFIPILAR